MRAYIKIKMNEIDLLAMKLTKLLFCLHFDSTSEIKINTEKEVIFTAMLRTLTFS